MSRKFEKRVIDFALTESNKTQVEITKKRMKNIRLTISKSGNVKISMPYFTSYAYAYDFLVRRRDWLNTQLNKIKQNKVQDLCDFSENGRVFLLGNYFPLTIHNSTINKVVFDTTSLTVYCKNCSYEYVKSVFIKWCKKYFEQLFEIRLKNIYFQIFNNYNHPLIKLKPMKSMWGNCNFVKRIVTLNLYLAKTPIECIDYVITHELAHLIHHNHSKDFHLLMSQLMPNWKERKKSLNNYSLNF